MKSRKRDVRRIVLASESRVRRRLLKKVVAHFEVRKSGYRERLDSARSPVALAKYLAAQKARSAARKGEDSIIIGADTFVVANGALYGKPKSRAHARTILRALSGRKHRVVTGFALLETRSGRLLSRAVSTDVWFKKLSEKDVKRYVASGEPMKAAGAYRIQKGGAKLVRRLRGDRDNVAGLPLKALMQALRKF